MARPRTTLYASHQIRNLGFDCQVAAIARFPEEAEELAAVGVCTAYNMHGQAGAGLARSALEKNCLLVPGN